jgi:hypothetical protein
MPHGPHQFWVSCWAPAEARAPHRMAAQGANPVGVRTDARLIHHTHTLTPPHPHKGRRGSTCVHRDTSLSHRAALPAVARAIHGKDPASIQSCHCRLCTVTNCDPLPLPQKRMRGGTNTRNEKQQAAGACLGRGGSLVPGVREGGGASPSHGTHPTPASHPSPTCCGKWQGKQSLKPFSQEAGSLLC